MTLSISGASATSSRAVSPLSAFQSRCGSGPSRPARSLDPVASEWLEHDGVNIFYAQPAVLSLVYSLLRQQITSDGARCSERYWFNFATTPDRRSACTVEAV